MPVPIDTPRTRELLARGAQLVDVLPEETFTQEHLPGAISIPLQAIDKAVEQLDRARPVIVYCYDYQCDLSPRAAHRLEELGFTDVHDYVASKAAWLPEGRPGEGLLHDTQRAGAVVLRDVPRVAPTAVIRELPEALREWELAVVVGDDDVVVGVVRRELLGTDGDTTVAAVMQTGPASVRPSI